MTVDRSHRKDFLNDSASMKETPFAGSIRFPITIARPDTPAPVSLMGLLRLWIRFNGFAFIDRRVTLSHRCQVTFVELRIAAVATLWCHRFHLYFVLRLGGPSAQALYSRATSAVSSRLLVLAQLLCNRCSITN